MTKLKRCIHVVARTAWRMGSWQVLLALGLYGVVSGVILVAAAYADDVFWIPDGVGLFQNYGLIFSFFAIPAILLSCRHYAQTILRVTKSHAILNSSVKDHIYVMIFAGSCFVISNIGIHLFGDSSRHWNSPVFDSPDHIYSFLSNRVVSTVTWVLIVPYSVYIFVISTIFLRILFQSIGEDATIHYDLIHPDRSGGMAFAIDASVFFNIIISLFYIFITVFIVTFRGINIEHVALYVGATLFYILSHGLVFGSVYSVLNEKKQLSLINLKELTYKGDAHSFEIYKFFTEVFSATPRKITMPTVMYAARIVLPMIFPLVKIINILPQSESFFRYLM
jgi:hypothetical protein